MGHVHPSKTTALAWEGMRIKSLKLFLAHLSVMVLKMIHGGTGLVFGKDMIPSFYCSKERTESTNDKDELSLFSACQVRVSQLVVLPT